MIKIRLARHGKRNAPFYRIVAIEHRRKREGKPQDIIGFFNPSKKELRIDKKKLKSWLEKGAKMSKTVEKLINKFDSVEINKFDSVEINKFDSVEIKK